MKDLKASVRNHARPEGCMAECNLAEESVTFFSEHMKRVDINNDQPSINEDYNDESTKSSILEGKPLLKGTIITLTRDMVEAAHRCILFNFEEVQPYIERHKTMLIRKEPRLGRNEGALGAKHAETFNEWFKLEVKKQREYGGFKVRINSLVDTAKKVPKEGWTMQDGTPWSGNNVRDHPGMI
ncbi:hypothetical protein IFM89_008999 [Coptis chinensis]|uniref:DUF4218 domain-containing protein n=1 Tax=Coptis chinensis TaxID=261450 RepID=A0A835HUR2_9MAGN|nr:hypothetical protein IFM89_008999 [Coptis chinensis]